MSQDIADTGNGASCRQDLYVLTCSLPWAEQTQGQPGAKYQSNEDHAERNLLATENENDESERNEEPNAINRGGIFCIRAAIEMREQHPNGDQHCNESQRPLMNQLSTARIDLLRLARL